MPVLVCSSTPAPALRLPVMPASAAAVRGVEPSAHDYTGGKGR
jgi:hypothetical protein